MNESKSEQNIIISTMRKIIELNFCILTYKNIRFNFLKYYYFIFSFYLSSFFVMH